MIFGVTEFLLADQSCSSTCTYQNVTQAATYCEDLTINSQIVPSSNCVWQTPISGTSDFYCFDACSTFEIGSLCLLVCPQATPYAVSLTCLSTCASGFYTINGSDPSVQQLFCSQPCALYINTSALGECVQSCPSQYPFKSGSVCVSTCLLAYND